MRRLLLLPLLLLAACHFDYWGYLDECIRTHIADGEWDSATASLRGRAATVEVYGSVPPCKSLAYVQICAVARYHDGTRTQISGIDRKDPGTSFTTGGISVDVPNKDTGGVLRSAVLVWEDGCPMDADGRPTGAPSVYDIQEFQF